MKIFDVWENPFLYNAKKYDRLKSYHFICYKKKFINATTQIIAINQIIISLTNLNFIYLKFRGIIYSN